MAQCKHAAEKGFVTCRAHRHGEQYRRGQLTADQLAIFGDITTEKK